LIQFFDNPLKIKEVQDTKHTPC